MNPPAPATERAFQGTFLHAPRRGALECLEGALIVVAADGVITAVHRQGSPQARSEAQRLEAVGGLIRLSPGHYVLPGLVDLHVHAPQWPQLGKALDLPLEDWLQKFTFPLEARYADATFATQVYKSL